MNGSLHSHNSTLLCQQILDPHLQDNLGSFLTTVNLPTAFNTFSSRLFSISTSTNSNDCTGSNWILHKNMNMTSSFSHTWIDVIMLSHCMVCDSCGDPCCMIHFHFMHTYPEVAYQLNVKLKTPILFY